MMKQIEGVKPLQFQAWVGFCSLWPLAALSALLEPGQLQAGLAAGWPLAACVLYSGLVVSVGAHTGYYFLIGRYEANLISPFDPDDAAGHDCPGVAIFADPFGCGWRRLDPGAERRPDHRAAQEPGHAAAARHRNRAQ